jgi:hypothetical protein
VAKRGGGERRCEASLDNQTRACLSRPKKLRLRLEILATAIGFVRREVLNPDMVELLRTGDKVLLYERETYQGLGDLDKRVKRLLLDIPQRKGSDKYFGRSEGATPQQNCALMISILWEKVHSKAPPNTKAEAQKACADLWKAAGGSIKRSQRKIAGRWGIPSGGVSTEVWRDHLRAAKRLAESDEAKFLRCSLNKNWDAAPERAAPEEVEIKRSLYR